MFLHLKKVWVLKIFPAHNIFHKGSRHLKGQRNLSLLKIIIGMNKDQCVSLTMTHNVQKLSTSNFQILIVFVRKEKRNFTNWETIYNQNKLLDIPHYFMVI